MYPNTRVSVFHPLEPTDLPVRSSCSQSIAMVSVSLPDLHNFDYRICINALGEFRRHLCPNSVIRRSRVQTIAPSVAVMASEWRLARGNRGRWCRLLHPRRGLDLVGRPGAELSALEGAGYCTLGAGWALLDSLVPAFLRSRVHDGAPSVAIMASEWRSRRGSAG